MNQQLISKVFKSKIGIFIIQVLILTLSILFYNYSFTISFDSGISIERKMIIQFLGNYILVGNITDAIFLYSIWTIVTMLPVFILRNSRRALGANLKLIFFPNFFFYLFLSRYSPDYFNSTWLILLLPFLIFAIIIILLSFLIPKIFQMLKRRDKEAQLQEVQKIANENRKICPNCGAKFESTPIFCYKCSKRLIAKEEKKQQNKS